MTTVNTTNVTKAQLIERLNVLFGQGASLEVTSYGNTASFSADGQNGSYSIVLNDELRLEAGQYTLEIKEDELIYTKTNDLVKPSDAFGNKPAKPSAKQNAAFGYATKPLF